MRLRVLRPSRRAARGQTLVLGALSFLILALMVVLSFNLSHALRKKISLQQHSDVIAYSMAVMEARALNYYAVSNRSIAASYVAMNSLHAYMAAASVTGQMMRAASENFEKIAIVFELPRCNPKKPTHCKHMRDALRISQKYSRAGRDYDNKVRGLESSFNTLQKGLDQLMDNLHASQAQVHQRTLESLRDGQAHGLSQLTRVNAPGASALPEEVGKLNTNEFDCAVDGKPCSGSVASSAPKARARVMTEVANASRPAWPANRGLSDDFPSHLHPRFLEELLNSIPGEGVHRLSEHGGTAKTAQTSGEVNGPGQAPGNEGLVIAANEKGHVFNYWKHGFWESDYKSEVWSGRTGGGHKPGGAHSGQHRFEGTNTRDLNTCARNGNCFMKFRANDDPQRDWGQPRVYSYLTRSLRGDDKGKPLPWELNRSASVTFRQGATTGKLTLAADEGAALSKALVYYHRFGANGWREAPNLFAPYWRAKLHPFTPQQAVQVLEAAQDKDAARLVQSSPGLSL